MTEAPPAPDPSAPSDPSVRAFIGVSLPAALRDRIWARARRLEAELAGARVGVGAGARVNVKWIRKPENLHVTLKFLGQIPLSRLQALSAALEPALADVSPFEGRVVGLGAFPDAEHATVIWAGVHDRDRSGSLAALARTVERIAVAVQARPVETSGPHPPSPGTPAPKASAPKASAPKAPASKINPTGPERDRPFRPHVTLGRCKRAVDVRQALHAGQPPDRGPAPGVGPGGEELGVFPIEAVDVYESILAAAPAPGSGPPEGSTYVLRGRARLRGTERGQRPLDGAAGPASPADPAHSTRPSGQQGDGNGHD
jgi:2'-5' RNA ligase